MAILKRSVRVYMMVNHAMQPTHSHILQMSHLQLLFLFDLCLQVSERGKCGLTKKSKPPLDANKVSGELLMVSLPAASIAWGLQAAHRLVKSIDS